jgi:hypothetical protein
MKYVSMLLVVTLALFPANAFATCPAQTGPYLSGFTYWYDFDFATSCAVTNGAVTAGSMWCYSTPAYSWDYGTGSVDYSMTVPSGVYSHFSVSIFAEFSDPHTSSANAVSATVYCYHNNSVTYSETFYLHQGNQGSLSCVRFDSGSFTASAGDTIEVVMGGQSYNYDTTMQISTPTIYSSNI